MPLTATETLPSGMVVDLAMPDLYSILATVGAVPSQVVLDAVNLLTEERVYRSTAGLDPDRQQFARQVRFLRGVGAIAALCITRPVVAVGREPGEGEIALADLTWADQEAVYYGFFRGYVRPTLGSDAAGPAADDAGAAEPREADGDMAP